MTEDQWKPIGDFRPNSGHGSTPETSSANGSQQEGRITGEHISNMGEQYEPDPIKGVVDKESRRAIWTFADDRQKRSDNGDWDFRTYQGSNWAF